MGRYSSGRPPVIKFKDINLCSSEGNKRILRNCVDLCTQEVKARVLALKERGPEGFRFYDFLEDKVKKTSFHPPLCGLGSSFLVPVAILLFSVVFLIAHPLILCRPGPK